MWPQTWGFTAENLNPYNSKQASRDVTGSPRSLFEKEVYNKLKLYQNEIKHAIQCVAIMDQRTYNTICRWHAFLKLKMLSFINSDCDLQRSEAYEIGLEFILVS